MKKYLVFLAVYLPFQIALNPTAGVDLASVRVLVLILFGGWLLSGLRRKEIYVRKNLATGFLLSFLFLSAFSTLVARNTDWSLRKLLFLFSLCPLYFVAAAVFRKTENIRALLCGLLLSGAAVAVIGIGQFCAQFVWGLNAVYDFWAKSFIAVFLGQSFSQAVLSNPSWLVNIGGRTYLRATATFPDPHMFSFYLGMLLPLALGLFFSERHRWRWGAVFTLLLTADILTFSRGGYLGLAVGGAALAVVFWRQLEVKYKLAGVTVVFLAAAVLLTSSPVSQRFFSSFDLREGSNQGRIETWKKAAEISISHPLLGVGIGNYPLEIKPTADYREPIYAHNTYLDIAAESGIFAVLAWIGLLGAAVYAFFRKSSQGIIFLMGGISLLIFAAHSLVETGIYSPVVLTLLLLLLSLSAFTDEAINKDHAKDQA